MTLQDNWHLYLVAKVMAGKVNQREEEIPQKHTSSAPQLGE